jgi:hypothetical protein
LYGHNRRDQNGYINWHWHWQCGIDCLGDRRLWIIGDGKHFAGCTLYGRQWLCYGWNADGGYAWSWI